MRIVLHPTIIITIIITITSLFLLSIDGQVAIDYLDVSGHLDLALLLLLLVLRVGGLLPQPDVLLPQLLVALLRLLEEMLTRLPHRALKHFRWGFVRYFLIMLRSIFD